MGLMDQLPMPADPGRLIVTPHSVLLDGQRNVAADLRPGESLYAFLQRNVDGLDGQAWAVSIGGREVPRHLWHCVYPKHGQVIEVRGTVGKSALSLVAVIALTYFTFGFGTATAGMWGAGAVSSAWGGLAATGVYMAGSMLINKVLAPKLGSATSTAESVYSLSSAQNRARPYEPLGLLFGAIRITPDLASAPYTWFEGDDQYLGMTLTPGLNVDRIDALYNGDTLLSSYEGVTVWHSGYSGMPEQTIPLYSNADTAQGGTLIDTSTDPKHTAGAWIERTSSADTIRLQVNIEFVLYDTTSKGKPKTNNETFNLQYRPTGSSTWLTWGNFAVSNSTQKTRRATYGLDVALGQYDVRVRVQGRNTDGKGASCNATWNTLTSIQQDTASYAGIPRTGIKIKATGQLNGALQEVRGKAYAKPLQLWNGSTWQTVTAAGAAGISNPGAQILYYARGIRDEDGTLIAGMGLDDDMIDIDALKAYMLYCADNGYTYDYWITDARSHSDVLDKIALTGMGEITWAGGKLSVVWAGAEQPLSGVVNMATIKKGSFQVDYALANAADGIEYSYTDPDTLDTKTLRVPAPGITTMLNPAQVAGEGITSEAHAARMARWHLAQSLYQYKSISYDTDLEHLSYRRLSMLALQHDLTQWGYGGRVRAAVNASGTVTLTLDEPVPAPAAGNAYIGLRIPGEAIYRVFAIQPFAGETTTITLADAWPDDAEVPGNRYGNPAWDTIWIYDFKQTPGYRVRVTGIEPESDLKGASISVVPEGPEFWTYVLTGAYTPAPNQSLLPTRPVASNLRVTERNVIQGDTVYTELQVTFDISGRAVNTVVSCDVDGDGQLDEVAQTVTRSASFRIPGAGSYTLLVRPYDEDGNAGVPATIIYVTASADQPPVLVDSFAVDAIDGGLRRYTWGYNPDTIQSPDFTGVEIRYTAGAATAPDWDNMTPLGDSGFHTAAFESAAPAGGQWTFACRSRNTSGTLSTAYRLQTVTLPDNLGAVIGGIDTAIEQHTAELVAAQAAIDQEVADRLQGDLDTQAAAAADAAAKAAAAVATAAADATTKANAARDDAYAYADVIGAQVADITGADEWSSTKDYPSGDLVKSGGKLYRALQDVPAGTAVTNTDYWQLIGNYSSLGEAVAASISIGNQNTSDIEAESTRLDGVAARMPAGTGTLATSAQVGDEATARANADTALSNRTTALESTVNNASTGVVATANAVNALTGRVSNVEGGIESVSSDVTALSNEVTTARNGASSLDDRIDGIDTTVASKASAAALSALESTVTSQGNTIDSHTSSITSLNSTVVGKADASALTALQGQVTSQGNAISAQGSALTAVKASLPTGSGNLIPNTAFEADLSGWSTGWSTNGKGASYVRDAGGTNFVPTGCHTIGIQPSGATTGTAYLDGPTIAIDPSKRYCYSGYLMSQRAGASIRLFAITWDNHETELAPDSEPEIYPWDPTVLPAWQRQAIFYQPTSAVRYLRVSFRQNSAGGSDPFSSLCRPMLEVASADQTAPSAWAPSAAGIDSKYASVTQSMQAQVTAQGNMIATNANNIQGVQAALPGKADASVVQSMQAQVTSQGNNIASILAQYFLAVNAGGKVAGMKIGSNGTTGSVEFLADIFRIVTDGSIGLEWQGSYLRAYSSGFQYIIGPGFGPGNTYVMWFGPNVGVAACTDALAISFAKVDGLQQTSGTLVAGLLAGSAMEMGSTRIHTGGGRLAPFIVKDAKYYVSPGTNASRTLVLDGFVGPSSGTGYHSKRFAAQRMDVWLDVQISGDTGTETAILEVAYDGNSNWTQITSVSFNCDYRGSFPLMVRYTTVDTWGSVAFRVRTTQNRTEAMRITAEIINANSSANDAGSSSNTTGGGSATPIDPNPWCVDYETTVLPDGRFVRDLRPGDAVECVDVRTGRREWIPLRAMGFGWEDCYRVATAHAEIIQSASTPMDMRDGSVVRTPDLAGCELLTHAHGFEVAHIEFLGRRQVCKPDFGDRMFFAGIRADGTLATHNNRYKPPL